MGKPVIASRIGGLQDVIIDGENGFLVPPGNAIALQQSMQRLLDDTKLRARMEIGALQRSQQFHASTVVPQIEAVYRTLIQSTAGMQGINEQQYEVST